jgi:WD40 repeat protein
MSGWSRLRKLVAVAVVSVVLVIGAVVLAYRVAGGAVVVEPGRRATLPALFPGHSFLTGDETVSPVGRAVALYDQSTGHEDFTFTQAVVAGADASTVRQVEQTATSSGPGTMLLRPDGREIAFTRSDEGKMYFLHLDTGAYSTLPTSGSAAMPVAWSPDGRYLAYLTGPSRPTDDGPLAILDTRDGTSVRTGWPKLEPGAPHLAVAFAPDGQQLAVQSGRTMRVLGLDGEPRRDIALPAHQDLAGSAAWSPDGSLLATVAWLGPDWDSARKITFLDANAGGAVVPAPIDASHTRADSRTVLGWRSPTELLICEDEFNSSADGLILAVSVHTGQRQRLSRFDIAPSDTYPVQNLQLATGLVAGIAVRSESRVHRGPWPMWLTLTLALIVDLLLLILLGRLTRVRRGRPGRPQSLAGQDNAAANGVLSAG